jgi:hypothetical protein
VLNLLHLLYSSECAMPSRGKMGPSRRIGVAMSPQGVAHRLFGVTKLRSARLDWPHCRANAGHQNSVNRPWPTKGITMLTESIIVNTPVSVDQLERLNYKVN